MWLFFLDPLVCWCEWEHKIILCTPSFIPFTESLFPNSTMLPVLKRYGNDAGQATDTALKSVVNVGVTAYNIDNLGIKAFLKTTSKETAKVMVKSQSGQAAEGEVKEEKKVEHQAETNVKEEQKKEGEKKKE